MRLLPLLLLPLIGCATRPQYRLATFSADVTVPMNHGMMGGAWLSKSVADPLEAHGFVLLGPDQPIVFVAVDWCEIRNDAYARWQNVLADAAGTTPQRVMVCAVHQHDAPVADLRAEALLRQINAKGTVCDPAFHELAVQRVANALRDSLDAAQTVTHIGIGKARVDKVASNRRYVLPGGAVRFDRLSRTTNPAAIAADEGLIDPWLRTLSFWNGDTPIAAVSGYAVHPMSHYGAGEVSADFPGLARRTRQAEVPAVKQIYFSGCSGNVVAGKYNDGRKENRAILAARLAAAMREAWDDTRRHPLESIEYRVAELRLEPRSSPGFTEQDLRAKLEAREPFQQCLGAMGLSWRERVANELPIEIPSLDLGVAQLLLLPGEAYVEFQLAAQRMRADQFIMVAGYGDSATGYIPTQKHIVESDTNLGDWCWVAPGAEARLLNTVHRAMRAQQANRSIHPTSN
jgi:hypothetical protein